jgi:hypothetical protein
MVRTLDLVGLAIAREGVGLGAEAVIEAERVVEDEVHVAEHVDDRRRRGHHQEARRPLAAAVEMLAPGIDRRREQAAFLPFERDLPVLVVPHRARAVTLDHEDHLLEQHPHRLEAPARRDLADIGVVGVAGADQVEIDAAPALPIPGRELDLAQVLDVEIANDRNVLRRDPFLVGGLAADLHLLSLDHVSSPTKLQ